MNVPVIDAGRLVLRPYSDAERAWFVRVFSDPLVMKHVGGAKTELAAGSFFDGICGADPSPQIHGLWCVEAEGEVVGHGSLIVDGDDLELGFIVDPRAWGLGYATEIGRALTQYVLVTLRRPRVIATVDDEHPASIRVLEKMGMNFLEKREDEEGWYSVYSVEQGSSLNSNTV